MLDNVKSEIDRPVIIAGVVGLVLGCLFGWIVLGWAVFPVRWTNVDPWDLRPDQKEVYIAMVADSHDLDQDAELARQRLVGFDGRELADTLAQLVEEAEKAGDNERVRRLQYLATALDLTPSVVSPTPVATAQTGTASVLSSIRSLLPLCGLALVLLVIAALIGVVIFRLLGSRVPGRGGRLAGEEPAWAPEVGREMAVESFETSYNFGDDGYDTSFNIETPGSGGRFYGACGVGFSEVLGEGSPDKVAAFEIWLFDKTDMDDVRTVAKVLMSEFAYNSPTLREKMMDRGEAVLAEEGRPIIIDGVGLELRAEILEFQYGADPSLPPHSYFQKVTTQLLPSFKV